MYRPPEGAGPHPPRHLFAGGRPARALLPVLAFSLLLSGLNLWLLGQPMELRTGL